MRQYTRRDFLQASLAASVVPQLGDTISFQGNKIVPLGSTGIQASRLAQGTGYNGYNRSSAQTRQGKEAFDRLLRHSLDQGINFIDMADLYGSHSFVKEVIKGIPRSKLVLSSKIWPRKEKWNDFSGGAKLEVERFCQELGTDMIDICLMYCIGMLNPEEVNDTTERMARLQ